MRFETVQFIVWRFVFMRRNVYTRAGISTCFLGRDFIVVVYATAAAVVCADFSCARCSLVQVVWATRATSKGKLSKKGLTLDAITALACENGAVRIEAVSLE